MALTSTQRTVLFVWLDQATKESIVDFIDATNTERLAILKAFAAQRAPAKRQSQTAMQAEVDRQNEIVVALETI